MKKAGKISAVMLSVAMLLSFSACSQGERPDSSSQSVSQSTPYEIYKVSAQKTKELKSADSDFTIDMTMEMAGSTITMKSAGNSKVVTNGSDSQYLIHTSTETLGQTMDMDYYFADGYAYCSVLGQKVKQKMDLSTFQKTTQNQSMLSNSFSEKGFENATVTEQNGETTVKATIPKEEMQSFFDTYVASALQNTGNAANMDLQYSDVNFETTTNADGYVKSAAAKCSITMLVDMPALDSAENNSKTEAKMNISIVSTYNNPGQEVTITPPADLDTYQESNAIASTL